MKTFSLWIPIVALCAAPCRAGGPVDVSDKAQLFVDQVLVRSSENVVFTLHPATKHPQNPLVKADRLWESWRLEVYGTVMYDEDEQLFKMWYSGDKSECFPNYATFYATSKNGITWEKPPVGTVDCPKHPGHNAVAKDVLLASVIKDKADPNPARRYKMVCWVQRLKPDGGPHTFVSPDGLRWNRLSQQPICRSSDVITAYYDRSRKSYVAIPKLSTKWRADFERRCFGLSTSTDFLMWTEPIYIFTPDLRDDAGTLARIEEVRPLIDVPDNPALMRTEFYGVGVYQAESCTLGFPWVFSVNNNARYGNHEGPSEIQLAVSRELAQWERPFRTPCIPRGKIGEWDCGFFVTSAEAFRFGDEILLYYAGSNYLHGTPCLYREEGTGRWTKFTSSIGLAIWKLDRFVSADGPAEGGILTTVPITFTGNRLELNGLTKGDGSITVEMLDASGKLLATSKPFAGDELRKPITWSETFSVSEFSGKPVMLRFHLKHAELYSFAFRQ